MKRFREHQVVELTNSVGKYNKGCKGTIIHSYVSKNAYEVEFVGILGGDTVTVLHNQIKETDIKKWKYPTFDYDGHLHTKFIPLIPIFLNLSISRVHNGKGKTFGTLITFHITPFIAVGFVIKNIGWLG